MKREIIKSFSIITIFHWTSSVQLRKLIVQILTPKWHTTHTRTYTKRRTDRKRDISERKKKWFATNRFEDKYEQKFFFLFYQESILKVSFKYTDLSANGLKAWSEQWKEKTRIKINFDSLYHDHWSWIHDQAYLNIHRSVCVCIFASLGIRFRAQKFYSDGFAY